MSGGLQRSPGILRGNDGRRQRRRNCARRLATPQRATIMNASVITPPSIFDSPTSRSVKVMGTSRTSKPACTVRHGIGQGNVLGLSGGILGNRNQAGHTATFDIGRTDGMTGTFRSDHDDVQVSPRFNLAEMYIEAMRKSQRRALLDMR